MHVIAHYRIIDSDGFRAIAEEPARDRPAHWRLINSVPTKDGRACFVLWWADSAEALSRVLRGTVAETSEVECHEVDEEGALGLDSTPVTVVRVARSDLSRHDPRLLSRDCHR